MGSNLKFTPPVFSPFTLLKFIGGLLIALTATSTFAQSPIQVSGLISGKWTAEQSPYLVVNDAVVAEGQTLEIDAGVTVLFRDTDDDIFINGTIHVNGTANAPVIFSSDDDSKAPGQWGAIVLGTGSDDSIIQNAIIEYGGGFRAEQLRIENASPTLRSSTLRFGRAAGLGVFNGNPTISGTQFSSNGADAAIIGIDAAPHITNSQAEGNGADSLGRNGGTLAVNAIWNRDAIPYTILNDIVVPKGFTLTIEAGTTIQFRATDDDLFVAGTLIARGEANAQIQFTSNESEKAPGQWGALIIQADSNESQLEHCRIEFGGGFRGEQLRIEDASPLLNQITVVGGRAAGLGIAGGTPTIRNASFSKNVGYAATATVAAFPVLENLSANDNGHNSFGWHGGTLSDSGTWSNGGIPYTVINDITVPPDTILNIESGNVIQFQDNDDDLWINGGIHARGTTETPIRFTSNDETKTPGQWGALMIGAEADNENTVFEHCIFEHGGGFRGELVHIANHVTTISNCQFLHSRARGLTLNNSEATISNSLFTENVGYAVGMDVSSFPSWSNNNAIANGSDAIAIFGGTLQKSGRLNFSTIPYTFVNDVTVAENIQLTIAAGNVIQFQDTDDDLWINGALEAIGTPAMPIRFTSDAIEKAPGQWGAILIGETANSATTQLIQCQIEYGGGFRGEMLSITKVTPTISQCTFVGSRLQGLTLNDSSATISQCHFVDNQGNAFVFTPPSSPNNRGNTAAGNGADSIGIVGGQVIGGVTWLNDTIPYTIANDITVTADASLTIEPGTTIQFRDTDDDLWIDGTLRAVGTQDHPIRFTSDDDTKAPGQWGALIFRETSSDSLNKMEHAIVQYGAGFRSAMVEVWNALPPLQQIEFHDSRSHGLAIRESSPTLEQLFFHNNLGFGIHVSSGANPRIQNNTFTDNEQGGVANTDRTLIVNAANNYWGDTSGPLDTRNDDELNQLNENALGDGVSEYVRWQPFLTEAPNAVRSHEPRIAVNTLSTEFGEIEVSQEASQTIRITNQGSAELTITDVSVSPDSFRTPLSTPVSLAPNETLDVPVIFQPNAEGLVNGSITIVSNDGATPSVNVALSGVAIESAPPAEPFEPIEPGTSRRITFDPNDELTPVWHPTDNRIAFATNRTPGQYNDLGMVHADGTEERLIATGSQLPFGIAPFGISWAGDSDLLMTTETVVFHEYISFDTSQAPFTRTVRDGDDAAFQRRLLIDGGAGGGFFTVSRDGTTALWRFSSRGGRGETSLRSAPFDSLTGQSARAIGTVHLAIDLPDNSAAHIAGAGLFSDGSQFVVSLRNGTGYDLYRYSTTQSFEPVQMTATGGSNGVWNTNPRVSPDNRTVVFAHQDPASAVTQTDLYTMNLETGALQNLTQTPELSEAHPSWSPEGTHIVYQRSDTIESGTLREGESPNWNLYILGLTGDSPTAPTDPTDPNIVPPLQIPQINASPTAVEFASTEVGSRSSQAITISNTGQAPLTIDAAQASPQFEAVLPSFPLIIEPADTTSITVIFAPTGFGEIIGSLTLESDDPVSPTHSIALSGTGIELIVPPPHLSRIEPSSTHPNGIVTIHGSGFSTIASENEILIGVIQITTDAASSTELRVQLPAELPSGTYPLSVSIDGRSSNPLAVTITPPQIPVPPAMNIQTTQGGSVAVTWADPSEQFVLETNEDLTDTDSWIPVEDVINREGGIWFHEITNPASQQYFRLVLALSSDSQANVQSAPASPKLGLPKDWEPVAPVLQSGSGTIMPSNGLELTLDGGGIVTVPPGATSEPAEFTIEKLDLDTYNLVTRSVYQIESERNPLQRPATMTLPAPILSEGDQDEVIVLRHNPEEAIEVLPSTYDPASGLVTFSSARFSTVTLERPKASPAEATAEKLLPVPFYPQEKAWWCWAAASQMMFKYYGIDVEIWKIAEYFNYGPETGPTKVNLWAGSYHRLFHDFGLEVYDVGMWGRMDSIKSYLIEQIDQQHPVMLLVQNGTHAVIVTGYNTDGVFINDPGGHSVETGKKVSEPFSLVGNYFTWEQFKTALFGNAFFGFNPNYYLPVWSIRLSSAPSPPDPPVTASILGFEFDALRFIRPSKGTGSQGILKWDGSIRHGLRLNPLKSFGPPNHLANDDQIHSIDLNFANASSEPQTVTIEWFLNGQRLPIGANQVTIRPKSTYQQVEQSNIKPGFIPLQNLPLRKLTPGTQTLLAVIKSAGKIIEWIPVEFETGPSIPQNLSATETENEIELKWDAVHEDDIATIVYDVFENNVPIGASEEPTFQVKSPRLNSSYQVRSRDLNTGLESPKTEPVDPAPPKPTGRWVLKGPVEIHGPTFDSGNPTTIDRLQVTATSATVDLNGNQFTIRWQQPPPHSTSERPLRTRSAH